MRSRSAGTAPAVAARGRASVSRPLAVMVLMLLAAGPASAQDAPRARPSDPEVPDCACRLEGRRVPLGTRACLPLEARRRLAVCAMVQNVPSWEPVEAPCPSA